MRAKIFVIVAFADSGIGKRLLVMFEKFPIDRYEIIVICMNNSIGIKTPLEFYSEGILIRDLKFYKTGSLRKVIKQVRPSILVIIAARHITERMIMIIGKQEKIPVIFIQHGFLTNPYDDTGKKVLSNDKLVFSFNNFKKYFYYFFLFIRDIIIGYFPYQASFKGIKYLSAFFLKLKMSVRYYEMGSERADFTILYSEHDKDFFLQRGYRKEQVEVIGMPIKIEKHDEISIPRNTKKTTILYIGGVVLDKFTDWGEESEELFLKKIKKICEENDFLFIYKAHPSQDIEKYCSKFKSEQIIFNTSANVNQLIEISDLIICQMSAALNYAISQYKPILIPKKNKNSVYVIEINKFGIGRVCDFNDLEEVILNFRNEVKVDIESYNKFIEYNIGKFNESYSDSLLKIFDSVASNFAE